MEEKKKEQLENIDWKSVPLPSQEATEREFLLTTYWPESTLSS